MILPVISNAGGDPTKTWYIVFSVRNPKTGKMTRYRMTKGVNLHRTLKEKRADAEKMLRYWTDKLKGGWTPFEDTNVIYTDNLQYQTLALKYRKAKSVNGAFNFYASKYIDSIKNAVEETTV